MKARQATQAIPTKNSGFYKEPPSSDEVLGGDTSLDGSCFAISGFCGFSKLQENLGFLPKLDALPSGT
ncbi:hypothetical protein DEO72_LG1g2613 [Vigna unguiculata]|uniref:Uncharacterized protein n=1 Tax=Vigna unguiculata TaxID=3917 RepID=A0A4D6KLQ9_VIGUN|nr:hypothetical protein DEO72_LG1g2613 [Vigna unguiculata]